LWIGSAEFPAFTLGEIASICAIQFKGRRPSKQTVKAVLADGPRPSYTTRQFPRAEEMTDPKERHLAVIHLHAQGWSVSTIARYLDVSRPTIYAILKRLSWRKGSVASLTNRMRIRTS
jgi:putative transposase